MEDIRKQYCSWYAAKYDELLVRLQTSSIEYDYFLALFPALELAALKHLENKQPTLLERIKWLYFLLLKKDENYVIKESQANTYDVIFWPSQPKHYVVQLPVYNQLKKQNISTGFVTNTVAIQELLIKEGVDYLHINRIPKKTNRFSKLIQNNQIHNLSQGMGSFKIGNRQIKFQDVIRDTLTYRVPADQGKEIYSEIKRLSKPKIILFGYSFSTLALANDRDCKKDGIVSASLQMGRMMYYLFKYSCLQVFYAYGKEVKEKIKEVAAEVDVKDVGSLKIEVTGYSPGEKEVEALITPLRKQYNKIGLVAFSGPGLTVSFQGHSDSLKALKNSVDTFKDVYFIIKLHLKDKRHYYTEFENTENILIIDNEHPIFKFDIIHLVKQSDFVLSGASTSLIESAYWMKPVISLDITGELQGIDLLKEDFIFNCRTANDLIQTIRSIISDEPFLKVKMDSMKKYIENTFRIDKLSPSELVANDIIEKLKTLNQT